MNVLRTQVIAGLAAGAMAAALSGCTTPTDPLESSAKAEVSAAAAIPAEGAATTQAAEANTANVLKQKNTVAQKGTFIRVLVNGQPITNYDIQRRAKFRQLRRLSASQDETINELIDERVKMTAAAQRNMVATDEQVKDAFANFAKGNKATPEKMGAQLDGIGIGADHFKEYIRAQITWSRLAGGKLQSETRQKTTTSAIVDLRKSGQKKPETTEYLLQQIVFVIPKEKGASMAKARTAEAMAYRQQYQGCAKAVELAKSYKDVAVKELGRSLQPELPQNWAEAIKATQEGQLTPPQTTDKGVEMIGICRAKITDDDRAAEVISQAAAFEQLEEKGDDASAGFLAELRKSSTIVYR